MPKNINPNASDIEKKLIQSEKLASIGIMAGGLAHEINSPLGAIILYAQMLQKEISPESPNLKEIQEIEKAALRCRDLVGDLLHFIRNEKETELTNELSDPNDALTYAIRLGRLFDTTKKVQIKQNLCVLDQLVSCKKATLVQIFLNIVQNGLHAMPEGGVLSLKSSIRTNKKKQQFVDYEITDTGYGISPENKEKIFDLFYTTKENGSGTGLGLYITKKLCNQIGASIRLENQNVNGVTCHISFPLTRIA